MWSAPRLSSLRSTRFLSAATPYLRRGGKFRASWTRRMVVDVSAYNLGPRQTRAFGRLATEEGRWPSGPR